MQPTAVEQLGGSFNLNFLVQTNQGRYVTRLYGSHTTAARLADVQFVRARLATAGIPSPKTVLTVDGSHFVAVDGQLLEVESYVEHDANMDTWPRLETGLPYLGRIHSLLRNLTVGTDGRRPVYANHISSDQALARSLEGAKRIRSWDPTDAELQLAACTEELARRVHEAECEIVRALPHQLVHGDFWDNNVLFRDDEVAAVIDLDFMGERLRIDDLALTLYFANATIGGDYLSDARIGHLRRLVYAYDSGLAEHLSQSERRAIPAAIARQTLWSMGGWVVYVPDEEEARRHANSRRADVQWTLSLMHDLDHWREAFS